MSVTASERARPQTQHFETPNGDEALMIIDMHRGQVGDRTRLDELEMEFPFLQTQLGQRAYMLDLTDNLAGTFKWRGAIHATHRAVVEDGVEGIWTNSAGNHARGVVLAARAYDIEADVRMPTTVSAKKRSAVDELWPGGKARATFVGTNFGETVAYSGENPGQGSYVHPFHDQSVMTGQGTVVDDMLDFHPDVSDVVVPVGGGGLIAGVANRLRERGREDVTIHAVTVAGSDSLPRSLAAHTEAVAAVQAATSPNRRYEGSCVSAVSALAVEQCFNYPKLRVHNVTDQEVERLIADYDQHRRDNWLESIDPYEPTTLVAVAGLTRVQGRNPVVLGTGRNAPLYPTTPSRPQLQVWNSR